MAFKIEDLSINDKAESGIWVELKDPRLLLVPLVDEEGDVVYDAEGDPIMPSFDQVDSVKDDDGNIVEMKIRCTTCKEAKEYLRKRDKENIDKPNKKTQIQQADAYEKLCRELAEILLVSVKHAEGIGDPEQPDAPISKEEKERFLAVHPSFSEQICVRGRNSLNFFKKGL